MAHSETHNPVNPMSANQPNTEYEPVISPVVRPAAGPTIRTARKGLLRAQIAPDIAEEDVWAALEGEGPILKESRKAVVRQVGGWVVKQSRGAFLPGLIRHSFRRDRYRRGWNAAWHLRKRGVLAPAPVAYIERGVAGVITANIFVSEYLDGYRNVEQCVRSLVHGGAGPDVISVLLDRLADAVNGLVAAGAYHDDLSGKNILTRNGASFHFIDLDAVELGVEYTDARRLRNHVQLYDSFCDELSDVFLAPFIARMLESRHDLRVWLPSVRQGQAERRRLFNERRAARS